MAEIQTSEVDAKFTLLTLGPWNAVCWCIFKAWSLFSKTILWRTKNINVEGGNNGKIQILFMEKTHEPFHLGKWILVQ
jgi:hypothetical protein